MSVDSQSIVTVLNYQGYRIIANSSSQSYEFEACLGEAPIVQNIPFSEIKQINGMSNAFREGYLEFENSEVYEALGIKNHKNILSNEVIKDMILNPTSEKLQKILDIQSMSYFERIKGVFIELKRSDELDISIRVKNLIEQRYNELRAGIFKSQIIVKPIKARVSEVCKLKEELLQAKNQIEELKKAMNTVKSEKAVELKKIPKLTSPKKTVNKRKT